MSKKSDREKGLAIMKASNEMLEQSKENLRVLYKDDKDKLEEMLRDVDNAKEHNIISAKNLFNASPDEIDNAEYGEVSEHYKAAYQKHLDARGVTDEQMHDKTSGGATKSATASASVKGKIGKLFSFQKSDEPEDDDNIVIDQALRVEKGPGYIEDDEQIDPEEFMKDMSDKLSAESDKGKPDKEKPAEESKSAVSHNDLTPHSVDFDPASIPPNVQYDIIPLPSKGECYPHKKARIPVKYLTAAEENIITSPNMYSNGQVLDAILKRCVLDKDFDVDEMVQGDRDAVILWLRMTGFGNDYAFSLSDPATKKRYETTVDLSTFEYKPFTLTGDEAGHFTYKLKNGDVLKFKFLSARQLEKLQNEVVAKFVDSTKYSVFRSINAIETELANINDENKETLDDAVKYIKDWCRSEIEEGYEETAYTEFITGNLVAHTVSVNGNEDRDFVRSYVSSLRIGESKAYRQYISDNTPGVDMSIKYDIPESDGGGSINSFLTYSDTIFLD